MRHNVCLERIVVFDRLPLSEAGISGAIRWVFAENRHAHLEQTVISHRVGHCALE